MPTPSTRRKSKAGILPLRVCVLPLRVCVQFAVSRRGLPGVAALRRWARAASHSLEVTLRVVGSREGRRLNWLYRRSDHATNVLSFSYGTRKGDIVLCHPVIAREARSQGKALRAHYAHLVVHGMLHLRGLDHEGKRAAARMEREEICILRRVGFGNPYAVE